MADVNAIIVLADVNATDGWRNAIQVYVDDVISTWILADVIANSVMWLMLLPLWQMLKPIGWRMADVKANVADVMATGLYLF